MPVRSSTLGDDVYTLTSVLAGFYVCNVAFDESEVLGGFFAYGGKYVVDIVLLAGGEVIQADYFLVFGEEKFNQVGAYGVRKLKCTLELHPRKCGDPAKL